MFCFIVAIFVIISIMVDTIIVFVFYPCFSIYVDVLMAFIAFVSSTLSTRPTIIGRDSVSIEGVATSRGLATVDTWV
jgi:hypothetical protein